MAEKSPRRFHKGVMHFLQQQENMHCQYWDFCSGEAQRQRESLSAEQYVNMFFTKTVPAVASKPTLLFTSNPRDESDQVEVSIPVVAQQNSFQTTLTATTPHLRAHDAAIRWNIKTVLSDFSY